MKPDEVRVAIRQFLDLVVNGRGSEEENIEALEVALDMLAWIHHLIDPDEEKPEQAVKEELNTMRRLVASQFPGLGSYHPPRMIAENGEQGGSSLRDAAEDLAAISSELYGVAWHFEHGREGDALAAFVYGYSDDWRERVRYLQWYLEAQRKGGT